MIAGDHHRHDPRLQALAHRIGRLLTRRIEQADEPEQAQWPFGLAGRRGGRRTRSVRHRNRQHPQAVGRERADDEVEGRRIERPRTLCAEHGRTTRQHGFRRPLHIDGAGAIPGCMEGRHALALGGERQLATARLLRLQRGLMQAGTRGGLEQRKLGWIADALGREPRVVVEHTGGHQRAPRLPVRERHPLADRLPGRMHPLDAHAVLRQRARLVRTDVRDRAEGFDRRQPPHQRPFPGHAMGAQGEQDRDHRRQGFRNRRDGEAHRGHCHQVQRFATQQPGHEDHHAQAHDYQCDPPPEHFESLLQRSPPDEPGVEHRGDAPELGLHARRDHEPAPASGHDTGSLEQQVAALGHPGLRIVDRRRGLRDHGGLAGQHGFVRLQLGDLVEPQVRGNGVARLDEHDVARHQLGGIDRHDRTVAQHAGAHARHATQGGQGALGPVVLHESDDGVQQDDQRNRDRVFRIADQRRQHARRDQHANHEIRELPQQQRQRRPHLALRQHIGPHRREPRRSLRRAQPRRPVHGQFRRNVIRIQQVPARAVAVDVALSEFAHDPPLIRITRAATDEARMLLTATPHSIVRRESRRFPSDRLRVQSKRILQEGSRCS